MFIKSGFERWTDHETGEEYHPRPSTVVYKLCVELCKDPVPVIGLHNHEWLLLFTWSVGV